MNPQNVEEIMKLITSEYSWEQVIYKVIAWEGLDPWDLNIKKLSNSFVQYITKMEQLDFKVPAKYVVIAAVLLRMKSDHLEFLDFMHDLEAAEPEIEVDGETVGEAQEGEEQEFQLNPITVPPKRQPVRRVMVTELISALRKVMDTEERRKSRGLRRTERIEIKNTDDVVKRISQMYDKISSLLSKINKKEKKQLRFSEIVEKWNRKNVVDAFLPLVYLENEKKVNCEQENMFDEIYITKSGKK
jgi:segregation and condensation protein A